MPNKLTSYQEKALMAAGKIASENYSKIGYEFHTNGDDLIMRPWHLNGRGSKIYVQSIRITQKNTILCRDEDLASELERVISTLQ